MTDEAVMCVKCGVAKGQGNNYCHNCGKPLAPDAAVCLNCGVANKQAPAPDAKSKLVAGLLAIFLGTFGVHNFYLGYTGKAVTQLVLSIVGILLCCVVVGVFIVMGVGTVDTTATEVSSAAETVQETPVTEQPVNNYQDYTANVQPQAATTAPVQQPEDKETNVLAIVSLVLGILSIVLGCCTGWIGALFGIGGIICAVFANKQGKTGLAKAGLICSIIGIVLGIIITILAAVFSVAFMSELANYY